MHASPLRCLAVWSTATTLTAGLVVWLSAVLAQRTAPARFDETLVLVCAAAGALSASWLWVVTTAVVLEAVRGGGRVPGVPGVVRRGVLAACGVAVLAGLSAPTHATPGEVHRDRGRPASAIAGLPMPDRAVALPAGAQVSTGPVRRPEPSMVVVRPGDTLWDLARAGLGPGADDASIAARWRGIYALNRAVIGPDPDLIQPAQRLRLPAR